MKSFLTLSACLVSLSIALPCVAAEGSIDVARIIDKPEAESILGEAVRPARPRNVEGADGYYSKCTYYSASSRKSLVVRLRQPKADAVDAKKEFEVVTAGAKLKVVDDLGEKAAILRGSPDNGLPDNVVMLYVVKGNTLLTIGVGGIDNEALAIEKVRFVARKILAQL